MFRFTRRALSLPEKRGQGLVEYALILSLVAIVVIVALAVMGPAISTVYCQVISQFPGTGGSCVVVFDVDVVVITNAEYNSGELHIDATSNGGYNPATILTATLGGVMGEKGGHYHLKYPLSGCSCEVTVTSSAGGVASVIVGP